MQAEVDQRGHLIRRREYAREIADHQVRAPISPLSTQFRTRFQLVRPATPARTERLSSAPAGQPSPMATSQSEHCTADEPVLNGLSSPGRL